MNENERLSLLGLFPVPDGVPFDQADIQQFIIYRAPLAYQETSINNLQYGANPVLDVKYYDGDNLVDVVLQINNVVVWNVNS
ncbi:MAG: hypothetical protein NZ811_00680 [Gammaproteobacteria bacterium]|nr:hypothetical protein [Gammaproteobacteria bacterium]